MSSISITASREEPKGWLIPMLVAMIGVIMAFLDQSVVNVAISSIMAAFNTDTAGVEWVTTAYSLAMAMVVPLCGWIGDRLGLKRLYLSCMVAFTVGSILCACSWNIESLIVARVLQALGGGMMQPTVMAIVFRLIPRDQLGAGMGVFGMVMIVAPALGPTLGGFLVEYANWRWIFLVNLPIGVIGFILGSYLVPEFPRPPEKKKLDIPGALTAAVGFAGLLFVLSKGNEWGWSDERTVLLLVGSLGTLALFILIQLWTPDPLLDLKVFAYQSFTLSMVAVVITTIGMFAALFYVPVFLQSIRGLGAMKTGMLMFPSALASGILMPISGKLYDKFGPRILMLSGVLFTAITTWLLSGINLETSLGLITLWLSMRGIALALMPVQMAAMSDIPKPMASRATAMISIVRNLSGSFGIAMMTVILTKRNSFHMARISDSLGPDNVALASWAAAGPATGTAQFQGHLAQQAFVMSIQDIFLLATGLILMALIPAFFLKKKSLPNTNGGPVAAKE